MTLVNWLVARELVWTVALLAVSGPVLMFKRLDARARKSTR